MADITIQKQGEVFISQSEYDALRLAGNLQSNTKYHITKTPKTGVDSLEQMNLLNGDKTVTYTTTDGMTVNGKATLTYDGGTTKDVTMDIDVPIVAGEGITINEKSTEEKVEVKLDTTFTDGKYVAKVTNIPYKCLYAVDNKKDILIPCSVYAELIEGQWTIAQRYQNGRLRVGTAVEDSDAMPKKQVEDGFVKKGTSNSACYCIDYTGSENMVNYSIYLDKPYTLAQRDVDYTLKVGTPVGVSDATTKAYVDAFQTITILGADD